MRTFFLLLFLLHLFLLPLLQFRLFSSVEGRKSFEASPHFFLQKKKKVKERILSPSARVQLLIRQDDIGGILILSLLPSFSLSSVYLSVFVYVSLGRDREEEETSFYAEEGKNVRLDTKK
jgi:hypothetical protein